MAVPAPFYKKKLKKAVLRLLSLAVAFAALFGSAFLTLFNFPVPPSLISSAKSDETPASPPPGEPPESEPPAAPETSAPSYGNGGFFKSKTVNLYPTDLAGYSSHGRVVFDGKKDVAALLSSASGLENGKGHRILIYCSHSTESYAESEESYSPSSAYSNDPEKSVLAVAKALSDSLSSLGFEVIFDKTAYDLPNRNGAFSRSGAAALKTDADLIIDLHRSYLTEDNLTGLRAVASFGGRPAAQVELSVAGGSEKSLSASSAFAAKLQRALENDCPTLTRPTVSPSGNYGYTGDAARLMISVGAQSNTLSEALLTASLLSRAVAAVINGQG